MPRAQKTNLLKLSHIINKLKRQIMSLINSC
jgi:hypothetical protein